MQYFDTTTPSVQIQCPFYVNAFGKNGKWKITKIQFCHNHVKHIAFTHAPCTEGAIVASPKAKRIATQKISDLSDIVSKVMLPLHGGSTSTMSGKTINSFLKSKGIEVSTTSLSRVKKNVQDKVDGNFLQSFQKLEGYLNVMATKILDRFGDLRKLWKHQCSVERALSKCRSTYSCPCKTATRV
jgi:hypothetical protein